MVEYAIGNVYVAASWSDYFTNFLRGVSNGAIHVPEWLGMDFQSATMKVKAATEMLANSAALGRSDLASAKETLAAFAGAPRIGHWVFAVDLPAAMITLLLTVLLFVGVKESARLNTFMVVLKVGLARRRSSRSDSARSTRTTGRRSCRTDSPASGAARPSASSPDIGFDAVSTAGEEAKTRSGICRAA
jgi:hypothetical protein